ncbi:hypothetical protein [Photorhabdus aegyptia]|uniref:hypothetical protein n=1 Tax=Photorhabdus aegyptia TaxID=2805098 RepID=UPI0030B85DA1
MQEEPINIPKPDNVELLVANEVAIENASIALSEIVSVVNTTDGRLEVFGVGTDNAVWHNRQTAPHSGSSWSGWISLNGNVTSKPVVYINTDGRLEVFARGTDNALWNIWQATPSWSAWVSLNGNLIDASAIK